MPTTGTARAWQCAGLATVALFAAACTFGERAIAPGSERTVVHAVLNPAAAEQFVLVERTLSGRVRVNNDTIADPRDPIVTGGGVPVHGARVEVRDANGATVVAQEAQVTARGTTTPRGTGMYRFDNLALGGASPVGGRPRNGLRIVPGSRLTLRVETPDAQIVTGQATVPGGAATTFTPTSRAETFIRDRDTLRVAWTPVPGARSYLVRVETPYGAFFLFSDSANARFTGDSRNVFAERLPRIFQAGFTQQLTVAAVDTAFFDYYRSANSPFTGSGLINRLSGGIGLFGAYVPVLTLAVVVRADSRDPLDARYFAPGPQGPELLRLWVDGRSGAIAEVTGAYRLPTDEQFGVLGTLEGTRLRLRAIEGTDARIVNRTLEGDVRGDTLRLQLRGALLAGDDGRRVFVRERLPAAPPDSPPR